MDTIFIRDLRIPCVIGVHDWERRIQQTVTIDLDVAVDLRKAGHTDSLSDTVDYRVLRDRIEQAVRGSAYVLLEALAERIAQICLEEEKVQGVDVTIRKPGAVKDTAAAGVRVSRKRA